MNKITRRKRNSRLSEDRTHKKCNKCEQWLLLQNFRKNRSGSMRVGETCLVCIPRIHGTRIRKETQEKQCVKCLEWKSIIEFSPSSKDSLRVHSFCKICSAERNKLHRQLHPDKAAFRKYKQSAKQRNLVFDLTLEDHFIPGGLYTFWQKSCYYCGEGIETVRLDRLDNTKGYILSNVVPCCRICNFMKLELTENQFMNHVLKIVKFKNLDITQSLVSSAITQFGGRSTSKVHHIVKEKGIL